MNLLIQETHEEVKEDGTPSCVYSDSGVYESKFTTLDEIVEYIKEKYGDESYEPIYAMNKIKNGSLRKIGWEIHTKDKYEDTNEEFDCIIQITVHEKYPEKVIKYNYNFF